MPTRRRSPARLPARPGRRSLVVLAVAFALLAVGSVAAARAHKTVTLEVDGEVSAVSTFAGSVAALLDSQGVVVGPRDVVAPGPATALEGGDVVLVRHAHPLLVRSDGDLRTVWTTALSADEVLVSLAARGQDVRLLPSRSAGRVDLALRLDLDGPVDVVVDGRTEHRADGALSVGELLDSLHVMLGEYDRVQVHRPGGAGGPLTVVVQRVAIRDMTRAAETPFSSVTEPTSGLYVGQRHTLVAGVPGQRTLVHRAIVVDGVEEARFLVSQIVVRQPVTEVVQVGTRSWPVTLPDGVWGALARCESGGNPRAVSANGLYYGLYQFSLPTWRGVGGTGSPIDASPEEQTMRAQALQARSGWGQWPACARQLGLI